MSPTTPNPPQFEEAVRAYLEPSRDQFNYEQLLLTFLSVDRFRQWAAVVARHRPLDGARFLSSGCGFAGSLMAYRDAGAAAAIGVDVDDEHLAMAALRIAPADGAAVARYDGRRLPFAADSFDVIESMDVIEHTGDPQAYLHELARVLAPGGVILLVTPNRLWPVEQHLGVHGPPWLPVWAADALFSALARLPLLAGDRRFRYSRLRGIRTQNISPRALRSLARRANLSVEPLRPSDYDAWPLPRHPALLERLAGGRLGPSLTPVRTIAAVLRPR